MDRRRFLVSSIASSFVCSVAGSVLGVNAAAFGEGLEQPGQLPAALRDKLRRDPFRPQFHLLPKANWMNDPCAPRFYRGNYHVFFQYNPGAAVWGDMHWAHATSPDMIRWKHLPIALAPTSDGYDAAGCFTGSVLPGMEVASIIYTGVSKSTPAMETMPGSSEREQQCIATSTDADLGTWKKRDKPVIEAPPLGMQVAGFRDPCPWKDGDTWYLIVGSGFRKVGGCVLLYRSSDGHTWEYLHPLAEGKWNGKDTQDTVDSGEMWECPDFFPLGEKHVLLYSTERKVYWQVGTLDKSTLRFHAETTGLLDHGSYYAMKSMVDAKDRRILWGWVTEQRSSDELKAAGWAGSMALPRVLTIGTDNRLQMEVAPEFASLHLSPKVVNAPQAKGALTNLGFDERAGAVSFSFQAGSHACGLELRSGATTLIEVLYDGSKPAVSVAGKMLDLAPDHAGVSTVHLWMDGSIVEVFVDGREAMTARSFSGAAGRIEVAWTGSADPLKTLTVAGVKPISADRLTS